MSVREQLDAVTGQELEAVWEARGWQVERMGNGDRGVDVRATNDVGRLNLDSRVLESPRSAVPQSSG